MFSPKSLGGRRLKTSSRRARQSKQRGQFFSHRAVTLEPLEPRLLLCTYIDQNWLDQHGPGPYYLDQQGETYRLRTDVTTDGTAFAIINKRITFDLNGHSITYGNATPITVANSSFESGTGATASGWDFADAPNGERFDGVYLDNEVYDRDYSLKFSSFSGDEYVESTSTVTLEANTTYSLSGMFQNTDWVSGASAYAKLVGQNVASEHIVSWANSNLRGIQFTEEVFTTGDSSETYKVVVGAANPGGATDYVAYIDDIKVQRTWTYGIAVSSHAWDPTLYPGITRYGSGQDAIIKNGTVTQGQDSGTWSHGIFNYATSNTTVDNVSITVAGANSSTLKGRDTTSWVITDNDLTSNVQTITSRDDFDGAVVSDVGGTISRNTIHNGVHSGIYAMRGTSTVADNIIQLRSKYADGFAILAGNGSEVRHNTINCGSGEFGAHGIGAGGNTSGTTAIIHDNIVNVQAFADIQEYGGAPLGGVYGIQVESGENVEVYENTVTAIADETQAYAFRMNDGGDSVYVHGNTFKAVRTGDNVDAASLKLSGIEGSALRFEGNTLESNCQYLGSSSGVEGVILSTNHLKASGDPADFVAIETANWQSNEEDAVINLRWIDNTYHDVTSQTLLTDASVLNCTGDVDVLSSFIHSFTTTIAVTNLDGQAIADAAVVISDKDGNQVFSGTTDQDGQVVVVLDEFRTQGSAKIEYGPYRVTATSNGNQAQKQFNAYREQTIEVQIDDTPTLSVLIADDSISENGGTTTATLSRSGDTSGDLVVNLVSSDTSEAGVPSTVTILAGNETVEFDITGVDDTVVDGDQSVTIVASANGFDSGTDSLIVSDDDELSDELIAQWTFNDGGGVWAADVSSSGADHTANLIGDTTWNTYGAGGALTFDGQGDRIAVPSSSDLNETLVTQRTVSGWFYADDIVTSAGKQVIYEEGGVYRGLSIYLAGGRLYIGGWNTPSDESNWSGTFLSTDQIQRHQWHHVALVLDGGPTVNGGALSAYLDGQLFDTGSGSQLWSHGDPNSIGRAAVETRFHDGSSTNGGHGFAGMLDDCRVYNRTLTSEEIDELSDQTMAAPTFLTVDITPDSVWENGSPLTATVERSGETTGSFVVSLQSSDPRRLAVPATIAFAAGQSSKDFSVTPQDNAVADGTVEITVIATAEHAATGIDSLELWDDEPAEQDLVAYWAMDEGAGTIATDTSPHGRDNSATLQGDTSWSQMGHIYSVQLDGDQDRLAVPDSVDLNARTVTQRTISAWFAVDDVSVSSRRQVIYEQGGIDRGLNIYIEGGQLFVGAWNIPTAESSWTGTFLATDRIQSREWHHVVLALDGSATVQPDRLKAYLDGTLFGSGDGSQVWAHADPTGMGQVAGSARFASGVETTRNEFAGVMDEARVYNRVLADHEIQVLAGQDLDMPSQLDVQLASNSVWENGSAVQATITRDGDLSSAVVVSLISGDTSEATVPADVTIAAGQEQATFTVTPQDDAVGDGTQSVTIAGSADGYLDGVALLEVLDNEPTERDLVAYWAFDEGTGTTVADTSPHGRDNSGTMGGNTEWVALGLNQALMFDGDGDVVAIPDSTDLNNATIAKRSISLWFAVDDATISSRRQMIYEEGGGTRGVNIYVDNGQLVVGGWNTIESGWAGTFLTTDQIQTGTWHHVALVLDGGSSIQADRFHAYLDGVLVGSGSASQLWAHGDDIGIGQVREFTRFASGEVSAAASNFAGMVDEVRVYNGVLSAEEIQVLAGQSLVNLDRLTVLIDAATVSENGGTTQATVTRSGSLSSALIVSLANSDTTGATVPGSVTIAAGQQFATFTVSAVNDDLRDGAQDVAVTATATGYLDGIDLVWVTDDEQVMLNGVVNNVTDRWTTVTLSQSFTSMIVIATPSYTQSSVPLVPRICNADGNSFELRVDRADGQTGAVPGVSVHYVVVNEGVYTVANDGVKMEAVKYLSTETGSANDWDGEGRNYAQAYQAPVVLGQVQTCNDEDFSVFWSMGAQRGVPASSSALRVGKHVGEDPDQTRAAETLGYLVVEAGLTSVDDLTFRAGVGGATVQGMDNNPPFGYSLVGLTSASVAVANQSGMYGTDGAWAVLHGSDAVSATRLNLALDEDQIQDAERSHLAENVSYLVFQDQSLHVKSGALQTGEAADVSIDALESLLGQATALWDTHDDSCHDLDADEVDVRIQDLADDELARFTDGTLFVDVNAAGHGWFVDPTPADHDEFFRMDDGRLSALSDGPAADRVDLLSVLAHELGHARGHEHVHDEPGDVMSETISVGERRLPRADSSQDSFGAAADSIFESQERFDLSSFFASAR